MSTSWLTSSSMMLCSSRVSPTVTPACFRRPRDFDIACIAASSSLWYWSCVMPTAPAPPPAPDALPLLEGSGSCVKSCAGGHTEEPPAPPLPLPLLLLPPCVPAAALPLLLLPPAVAPVEPPPLPPLPPAERTSADPRPGGLTKALRMEPQMELMPVMRYDALRFMASVCFTFLCTLRIWSDVCIVEHTCRQQSKG